MLKQRMILVSMLVIGLFATLKFGPTGAFFSKIKESMGNIFRTAEGFEFDLLVNGQSSPSSIVDISNLAPGENRVVEKKIRINGTGDTAKVFVHLKDLESAQGEQTEPETEEEAEPTPGPKSDIDSYIDYDLTSNNSVVIDIADQVPFPDVVSCWIPLGTVSQNADISILQSFHFDETVTNWAQGDVLTFVEEFLAQSVDAPLLEMPSGSSRVWNQESTACVNAVDQLTGSYLLKFTCTSGCSGVFEHTKNITTVDDDTGNYLGSGFYNLNPAVTWNLNGNLSGSAVNFTIIYTGLNPGYTINATGIVHFDGSMSGTATGPGQTFTWTAKK